MSKEMKYFILTTILMAILISVIVYNAFATRRAVKDAFRKGVEIGLKEGRNE